jgi:hypothetical protein
LKPDRHDDLNFAGPIFIAGAMPLRIGARPMQSQQEAQIQFSGRSIIFEPTPVAAWGDVPNNRPQIGLPAPRRPQKPITRNQANRVKPATE